MSDPINPDHYRHSRQEVVDTLEDWVKRAPDPIAGAHHFNAGKYLGRLWDKGEPCENAEKAIWYLNRLVQHLKAESLPFDPGYRFDYEEILLDYGYQRLVDEAPDNSLSKDS